MQGYVFICTDLLHNFNIELHHYHISGVAYIRIFLKNRTEDSSTVFRTIKQASE